jgi:chemosensory pili system protein ChpE
MVDLAISAAVLGIVFCAPPGVVTAEAVRRGLARGFWAAFLLELGSLIGDATWAITALAGAALLVKYLVAHVALGLLGAGLLFYLAWSALRDAIRGGMPLPMKEGRPGIGLARGDFATGALLSLGNPFAIAFWLGAGNGTIASRVSSPQPVHFIVFFVSFMLAALVYCFFLAGLVAWGKRSITPAFFRWVNILCGVFLGYFGVQLLVNTMRAVAG